MCLLVVFLCFLREIEWVDRDVVIVLVGIGVEMYEVEWFGCSGVDDFVDVDVY